MQYAITTSNVVDVVLRGGAWFGLVLGFAGMFFNSVPSQASGLLLILGYGALMGRYQLQARPHMTYLVGLSGIVTAAVWFELRHWHLFWWMQAGLWVMFVVAHLPLMSIFLFGDRFDETEGASLIARNRDELERDSGQESPYY